LIDTPYADNILAIYMLFIYLLWIDSTMTRGANVLLICLHSYYRI